MSCAPTSVTAIERSAQFLPHAGAPKPPSSLSAHPQVYDALNVLGAVPWQINRAILSVVEQLYEDETGYKHLKIPAKESFDLPLPSQPLHAYRTARTKGGALIAGVRKGTWRSRRRR